MSGGRVTRRDVLAGVVGAATTAVVGGAVVVARSHETEAAPEAVAPAPTRPTVAKPDVHPVYRRGAFPVGSTWTAGASTLTVTAHHPVTCVDGHQRLDDCAVKVVFAQTDGPKLADGLATLSRADGSGSPVLVHLTITGSGDLRLVINRHHFA